MSHHTARRPRGTASAFAGRTVLTTTAAFALLGGGAGMAFAGDSSVDTGSGDSRSSHSSDHHDGWGHNHKGHHHTTWDKPEKCEIPIYDPADKDLNAFLDKETHGEYSTLGEPVKPTEDAVHDAICPPAKELLGAE